MEVIYRKDEIRKDCRLVLTSLHSTATRLWTSKGKLMQSFRHIMSVSLLWFYIMIKTDNQYFPATPGSPRLSTNLLVAENGFNRPYNLLINKYESWKLSESMIFRKWLLPYKALDVDKIIYWQILNAKNTHMGEIQWCVARLVYSQSKLMFSKCATSQLGIKKRLKQA